MESVYMKMQLAISEVEKLNQECLYLEHLLRNSTDTGEMNRAYNSIKEKSCSVQRLIGAVRSQAFFNVANQVIVWGE